MKVVVLEDWNHFFPGAPSLEQLRERVEVEVQHDQPANQADLVGRLRDAQIVVLNRERTRFSADVIDALPALELILQTGGISPSLDVAAATARGVAVMSAPGLPSSPDAVAELALGLLLGLVRQIPANDRNVRAGRWEVPPTGQLNGKTMGILGLGRIGRILARYGHALQMPVLAAGLTLSPERAAASQAEYVSLDELFTRADAIFVCLRLADRTRGLVSRRQIQAMKPSSYLINIARGPIVDEDALVEALQQRRIAGAGLDVFDREPLPVGHRLTELDNVILSPHLGWVTAENTARFVETAVEGITRYLDGDLSAVVNPEALRGRQSGKGG